MVTFNLPPDLQALKKQIELAETLARLEELSLQLDLRVKSGRVSALAVGLMRASYRIRLQQLLEKNAK